MKPGSWRPPELTHEERMARIKRATEADLERARNDARREAYNGFEVRWDKDGREFHRPKKDAINARRREHQYNNADEINYKRRAYYDEHRDWIRGQANARNYPNTQRGREHIEHLDRMLALEIERQKRVKASNKYYARKESKLAKIEAAYAAEKEARRIEELRRLELNKRYELALQEPGIGHNRGPVLLEEV